MKSLLLVSLLSLALPVFASWNEVECEGTVGGKQIEVAVEQPFPNGSFWKQASLRIDENGTLSVHDYTVTTRVMPGFSRVEYMTAGFRLEVDFWPDQRPRWGMRYRGTFQSAVMNHQIQSLTCRFPNAF